MYAFRKLKNNRFIRMWSNNGAQKVAIALSGGVDSSVSAFLLKKQGFDVVGIYMKNWSEIEEKGYCEGEKDKNEAEKVANFLGIEFYVFNFEKEYWNNVFQPMIEGFSEGITPNPDVLCNKEIKFKVLLEKALGLGANYLATGHYARIKANINGSMDLCRSIDLVKDQTFFLSNIEQKSLENIIFPIGHMLKKDVKELASKIGLPNANRKESMGICFVGKRKFSSFLSGYIENIPGDFYHIDSNIHLGTHNGFPFYTVGQCARIDGKIEKYYIISKNKEKNVIYVGPKDHPLLYCSSCVCDEVNWVSNLPSHSLRIQIKIRHPCSEPLPLGHLVYYENKNDKPTDPNKIENNSSVPASGSFVEIVFDTPIRSLAVGQTVAIYLDDVCLGGAKLFSTASDKPRTTNSTIE